LNGSVPEYVCRRARGPIEVNGDLSKPAWRGVPEISLVLVEDGAKPDQPTTVRMLWDDEYLYFAFHAVDRDIWGTYRQRNDPLYEQEIVEMLVDPLGLGRLYFEFSVSPHNVVFDGVIVNRMREPYAGQVVTCLRNWDCTGLRTAVKVDGALDTRRPVSRSWDTEVAMPFRELAPPNCPPKPGDVWRLGLFRIDRGKDKDEYTAWHPTGKIDFHRSQYFGKLRFE